MARSGLQEVILRPSSGGSKDTYAFPRGSRLDSLARSLGDLAPEIGKVRQIIEKQEADRLSNLGSQTVRQLFEQTGKNFKKMVKDGDIDLSQNPWFRYGAEMQGGRLAASQFEGDFMVAAEEALADSTSLDDFDSFAADFSQRWTEGNLPERSQAFEEGFGATKDQILTNLRRQHAARVGQRVKDQTYEGLRADAFMRLEQGVEPADVQAWMDAWITDTGADARTVMQNVGEGILSFARQRGSWDAMGYLKQLKDRSGRTLESLMDPDRIQQAASEVRAAEKRAELEAAAEKEAARTEVVTGVMVNVHDRLQGNAYASVDDLQNELERVGAYSEITTLHSIAEGYQKRTQSDHTPTVRWLALAVDGLAPGAEGQMLNLPTLAAVFREGRITEATYNEYRTRIDAAEKDRASGGEALLSNPILKDAESGIRALLGDRGGILGWMSDGGREAFELLLPELRADFQRTLAAEKAGQRVDWNQWRANALTTYTARYGVETRDLGALTPDRLRQVLAEPTAQNAGQWKGAPLFSPASFRSMEAQLQAFNRREVDAEFPARLALLMFLAGLDPTDPAVVNEYLDTQGQLVLARQYDYTPETAQEKK